MRFRKLRIAWSVGWGIVAVLLVVLWQLAYVPGGYVHCRVTKSSGLQFTSVRGQFDVRRCSLGSDGNFKGLAGVDAKIVSAPCWLTVAVTVAIAAFPWLQFGLRTLLIATTLVAVALGLVVWAVQ